MGTNYVVDHLTFGSQFPQDHADGHQHYRTDGNNAGWFTWDNTRGKWLSNEAYLFDWDFASGATTGSTASWTIPLDATVVALYGWKQAASGAVTFQVGGASGPTLTVATATQTKSDFLNPNFDVTGGAAMSIAVTSGTLTSGGTCRAILRRRLT